MKRSRQKGIATVEFAIIGAVLMVILFGVLEFGRFLMTYAVLNEGTRRAARVATVCPVNDPSIAAAAGFANLPRFTNANVAIDYLDQTGAVVGSPATAAGLANIRYVRVRIVSYTHDLLIPFHQFSFTTAAFPAVLPRESLGIVNGVATAC